MTVINAWPRVGIGLLLLLASAIWFSNLEYRKLVQPDEGRYAEIPREMTANGDWVTPRLNGLKYFEKPPLQYWVTAAAYRLFGERHWTARLWSALTGFACVLLVFFAGRRLFGHQAGLYTAMILGSSLLFVIVGHINTLDMGVTFFMTLALVAFLFAQGDIASEKEKRNWMGVAWGAAVLSVLSKGLMGVVLPALALAFYSLLEGDWSPWKRLRLATGLPLFLLLAAPWFVAVSAANPEFFRFFFVHEHFERFLTQVHGRYQPWWFFIPILLLGILPWVVLLLDTLANAWRGEVAQSPAFRPQRFLLAWALTIFVFFSLSGSKLPSYILPVFPALALLMGVQLTRASGARVFWYCLPLAVAGALGLWVAPRLKVLGSPKVPAELYAAYGQWIAAASLVALLAAFAAAVLSRRGKVRQAVTVLALAGLVASQLAVTGHDTLSAEKSGYFLAQKMEPFLQPGTPVYSVRLYEQTIPFYIKRTVIPVEFEGELQFGLRQEPDKGIADLAGFIAAWNKQPAALALMPPETYLELQRKGLPMEVIASNREHVVVRKP